MGDNIIGNLYRYTLHFVKFMFYFIFFAPRRYIIQKGKNVYLSQERRDRAYRVINNIYIYVSFRHCLDRIRDVALCIVTTCLFS